MTINWSRSLIGQLEFYWEAHLRPRLEGLTDEEYFWEPVDGGWSLHPTGDGRWRMDHEPRPPGVEPFTSIAWRMTHIAVEVLESRYRAFFGGEGPNQWSPGERLLAAGDLPGSAAAAVAYLTAAYTRWRDAVAGLSEDELRAPLGPKGADFAAEPMAELVLHLNRETMHHGGEICLLRDLYRASGAAGRDARLVPR
jgi:hypothetical protein